MIIILITFLKKHLIDLKFFLFFKREHALFFEASTNSKQAAGSHHSENKENHEPGAAH